MYALLVYYHHTAHKQATERQATIGLALIAAWLMAVSRGWLTLESVGLSAMSGSVVMYAMPLVSLVRALKQAANVEGISLHMAVITLLVSSSWVAYGSCINDHYVLIPNALGVGVSTCQLVLWRAQKSRRRSIESSSHRKADVRDNDPLLVQRTIELRKL